MRSFKLKAGALQVTLFIIVVIGLLLATVVLLTSTHKYFNLQTNLQIDAISSCNRGIDYALLNNIDSKAVINLDNKDYETLIVDHEYWGIFEKLKATSTIKNYQFQKMALIGASQSKNERAALYVKEHNKPLVVVGNTKIDGTAYLPKKGVKAGTISGHSYYGSQLIYGQSKVISKFPALIAETFQNLEDIGQNAKGITQNQYINIEMGNSYANSFLKPLKLIHSPSDLILSNSNITGHILITSKTKITVEASAVLKDVVLIAPKIEIKNNVNGAFQCIASKEISVGSNCKLDYPSALVLHQKDIVIASDANQSQEINQIVVNQNSTVKGVIVYLGQPKRDNFDPQIIIAKNTIVSGEIYCNQNLELKGSVFGSVYTSNFLADEFGSTYQNHIYNGRISIDKLPTEYVGLPIENSNKGILKWLY